MSKVAVLTRRWLLPVVLVAALAACGKKASLRLPRPGEGDEEETE